MGPAAGHLQTTCLGQCSLGIPALPVWPQAFVPSPLGALASWDPGAFLEVQRGGSVVHALGSDLSTPVAGWGIRGDGVYFPECQLVTADTRRQTLCQVEARS